MLAAEKDNNIVHEFADVNGVTLHYARAGKGKHLIMFVHGFPEFWYEYKDQLQEFSNTGDYTVIAPDMRGYNLSSKPATLEEYQAKYIVEDLRQIAEKLGYKVFTLVGHDWGGVIAWWFAIIHPQYLNKLVIINAPHPAIFERELSQNLKQKLASIYMILFRSFIAEPTLAAGNYWLLKKIVFGELKAGIFTEADKQEYVKAWAQPGALTGGLNYYRANKEYGYGIDNSSFRVNVPTLVIWGDKDQALLASNLTGLEQYVPELTIKRISDASHWVIHEQPELVNNYINEFIQEQ